MLFGKKWCKFSGGCYGFLKFVFYFLMFCLLASYLFGLSKVAQTYHVYRWARHFQQFRRLIKQCIIAKLFAKSRHRNLQKTPTSRHFLSSFWHPRSRVSTATATGRLSGQQSATRLNVCKEISQLVNNEIFGYLRWTSSHLFICQGNSNMPLTVLVLISDIFRSSSLARLAPTK